MRATDALPAATLDCSSIDAARTSVARLMGIREDDLRRTLRALSVPRDEDPVDFVARSIARGAAGLPAPAAIHWFHVSRVADPETFRREGILTKARVSVRLRATLAELASGLTRQGTYRNAGSVGAKGWINDEGPFAFLFRNVAIEVPGATHAYAEVPELVEDLAGELLGANDGPLIERFRARSVPCVVKFRASGNADHVARVLWYLYRVENGSADLDAAAAANTFYDGAGVPVPSEDIVSIERL